MYIFNNNNKIVLIRCEIHIINNLSIKIFIDIIKSEIMVLNIIKNLIIIELYNLFQISIFIVIKNFKINIIIINKTRYVIFIYLYITIFIKFVNLLTNRDFIFKLNQLNILTFSINIVDYNLSHIIIRNDITLSIILIKYIKFNKILKYKTANYF